MRSSREIGRRRRARAEQKRVLIVTEGEVTEVQYIQGLLQHLRRGGVSVRPATTKGVGRDPLRVFKEAERALSADEDGFDSIWIVVDVDDHVGLDECLQKSAAAGYMAVVSNPCFEVWLLWHFEDMNAHQSRTWLRRRLRDLGQDGKAIMPSFPFRQHGEASARADASERKVEICARGPNPSCGMPHLVAHIRRD